jgi:DNA-binding NtrC family response regulator
MSPGLQAKLLRVTQDGRFQRIGSNREIHTTARILAASNRNLEEEVKSGRFREDLFYRLNVVELALPPLRERREDILPLANFFIAQLARTRTRLAEGTVVCLQNYSWPGNVRELRNILERAVLLSQSEMILPEHLPAKLRDAVKSAVPAAAIDAQQLDGIERQAILSALAQHKFNRTETAKALGISRRALIYKLQRFRQMGLPVD